ncbi:unnamed protein product [Fusarium graminearum]|nr:unnamed protein product [Fusarium graminearum]
MTSYGDVRKIIEDVVMIANTLKTVYKADEALGELIKETQVLTQLADDVQKSGSNFVTNKDFQKALKETNDMITALKKHLEKRKKRNQQALGQTTVAKPKGPF